jgi:riboflavin kinase / FMN adenylyltransferase
MCVMPFLHLHDPDHLPPMLARPVLAIGNFDGMHLGHQAVLSAARDLAHALKAPACILTFEPHPRSYFRPEEPVFRLTPPDAKAQLAERFGMDGLIELPFDAALAALDAEAFVKTILVERFAARGVAVGYDFSFGKARQGDAAFLIDAGKRHRFSVSIVPKHVEEGAAVSSSAIRSALEAGDVPRANTLLHRPYAVIGDVIHGRKLGRTIGYPTANIALDPTTRLRHGIYAVRMRIGGIERPGVASFGTRPTFDDGPPLLEVFLFDFDSDLYGETVEVSFVAFLRPELKFDGVEPLIRQMDEDTREARRILKV